MSYPNSFLQCQSAVLRALAALAACALCALAQAITVIEYHNKSLDAYFITGRANEQNALDAVADFRRTGMSFQAEDATSAPATLTKVCRFYVNVANPLVNSHFYGRQGVDCESILAASPAGFNYEGYDFALQTPTAATCPAGTTAVYRSFRALAGGKTSNHRYTVSAATYASAAVAGYVGEGAAFCVTAVTDTASGPSATAVGTATGTVVTASIGAAGGSLTSGDGKLVLTVPAGALAANTTIGIQPITNFAHGKIGSAYRLTPDGQTFSQPVSLSFAYADEDLVGAGIDVLGVAFQTTAGLWRWAGDPTVNAAAKTVSVNTTHFTDWSRVKGIQMRPPSKAVRVKGSVSLVITDCYPVSTTDPRTGDQLAYLGYRCDGDDDVAVLNPISDWSVNGVLGGGSVTGTVTGSGTSGTFVAPATKPSPNNVTVSARVKKSTLGQTVLVSSSITITEDSWMGTSSCTVDGPTTVGQIASATVVWEVELEQFPGEFIYRASGTANLSATGCSVTPPNNSIKQTDDGKLIINYNATPPTYEGVGNSSWPVTLSCTDPTFSVTAPVTAHYFGTADGLLARGVVSPDGKTIQGSSAVGPTKCVWKFTRN